MMEFARFYVSGFWTWAGLTIGLIGLCIFALAGVATIVSKFMRPK